MNWQTKTKGTGSLRATKWYQELCNGVKGNEVIREINMHSEREWTIDTVSRVSLIHHIIGYYRR